MKISERIKKVPPYISAEIDKKVADLTKKGIDVITLAIGDPDIPTPENIIKAMEREIHNPAYHRYPAYEGSYEFRCAVSRYYSKRFEVELDPDTEVMALIGSKEGIVNTAYAFIDEDDYALIPDPAYPVYKTATLFAGGIPYTMPLLKENKFLPDFTKVDKDIAEKATIMFLCYPNNPTSAVANKEFFEEAIEFAKKYDIVICHDSAYADIIYEDYKAPSILSAKGAKEVAIELGSLSKPYRMTGWRIGYAVGNNDIIKALGRIKTNVDSGQFTAIQSAAVEALSGPQDSVEEFRRILTKRRNFVFKALKDMGFDVELPQGTFYIWASVPKGYTSASFAEYLVDKAAVVVIPGNAYGEYGEGFFRISLTTPDDRIDEALSRMRKLKF